MSYLLICTTALLVSGLTLFSGFGLGTLLMPVFALANGELCVCDIANAIGLSIPATSQQLKLLRHGNVVRFRSDGKMAYYSLLNPNLFDAIRSDTRFVSGREQRKKQTLTAL